MIRNYDCKPSRKSYIGNWYEKVWKGTVNCFSFYFRNSRAFSPSCVSTNNSTEVNLCCGLNCGNINLQVSEQSYTPYSDKNPQPPEPPKRGLENTNINVDFATRSFVVKYLWKEKTSGNRIIPTSFFASLIFAPL